MVEITRINEAQIHRKDSCNRNLQSCRDYHFRDKYDLVVWMFCSDAYNTNIVSVESAAAGMNKMKQQILFYKRAYEDNSQDALWRYMLEFFVKRYSDLAKEKLGTSTLDTQLAYSIRFYCIHYL